ncbi:tyrosine--tRNA ligase [Microvirga lotononidis]|uniref:Tyrosine--tRNA ligase n=1 Tax=Microvirga lotononidis TaxID=864069 RepID=I4YZT5_9HYPH|nr:tyrosine--tRNA ligase [Microvirga lotononidis]EIM29477.1 tyrosyl-tRNA synthetase [Microvirga lotononidis]WQO27206.1 tyrosine--tRNA ligase [Microvirga lotononidis]
MNAPRSEFLKVLTERGFIHQTSDFDGVDTAALESRLTTYVGYDCTGPSLHVGHLLSIMMLHWLQKTGAGRPITLMGGGTTRVGDPSGKDESRKLLTVEQIEANKDSIRTVFSRFISFGDGKTDAMMVDNAEWLTKLNYIDFLRDVGRHFSVNRMLSFDSVKLRLDREHELSFLEFNYMILQAYDFVELNKRYGCVLQMGGSDQWGNIVNGIDLGRRLGTPQLYAVTCPLLTTASGAKMGKTASGAVWLNADMLSPYDYWQFWRNTEDADVGRFLKLFTILPMDEIAKLSALQGAEINEAKKILATEATALLHGREAALLAAETAQKTFEQGALAESLPTVEVQSGILQEGLGVLTAFGPDYAKLVPSSSEARRQVKSGGLKVNDETVSDERATLGLSDLTSEGVIKLSFGKKKHVLLRAV